MSVEEGEATELRAGIRPASERDLPRILEIERASFPTPWPEGLLRGHLGTSGFLVYEEGSRVIGYIITGIRSPSLLARLERRASAWIGRPFDPAGLTGHIMNLAIAPAHRGRGVAASLLHRALAHLAKLGARAVELEVRVNNEAAVRLYKKHGFEIKGRIPNYYRGGVDAYLMARPIERG